MKLLVVFGVVKGKCVVMIDDLIVRGMIFRRIVGLLREVGVSEVYVVIVSLELKYFCFYGIDI